MDILKSVYTLAKHNNGYFKSEKQASFLKSRIDMIGCFCESFSFGYHGGASNTRTIHIDYDDHGITSIRSVADKSKKEKIIFTRKSEEDYQKQIEYKKAVTETRLQLEKLRQRRDELTNLKKQISNWMVKQLNNLNVETLDVENKVSYILKKESQLKSRIDQRLNKLENKIEMAYNHYVNM